MGRKLASWRPAWTREQWQHVHRVGLSSYGALIVGLAILAALPGRAATPEAPTLTANADRAAVKTSAPQQQSFTDVPNADPTAISTASLGEAPAAATATPSPLVGSPPAILEDGQVLSTEGRPHLSSRAAQERSVPAAASAEERFIADAVAAAQASQRDTGVPASVTLAQAILESNWGKSKLTLLAKNYFGMKATSRPGPAGVVYIDTWEHLNGRNVTVRAAFRAYNSMAESFTDHGLYLRDNKIYAEAMKHTDDARQFARLIHAAGYATDPNYAAKLIRLMDRYNLYQYDN